MLHLVMASKEKIEVVNELHKDARKNYPRRRTIIKGLANGLG